MSRWEFMRRLEELLFEISPNEREAALQYYNDYFNDAGMENEQEVIRALGSPEQVAQIVKDGLGDGGSQGEFTENGFSSSREGQNELMRRERAVEEAGDNENGFRKDGESRGQNAESFEKKPGEAGKNTETFRQASSENGRKPGEEKKDMPTWAIVLIVLACVIGSPVILSLACGAIGVIIGVIATVLGLVLCLGLATIILFIVALSLVVAGFGVLIPHPFSGIGLLGGGCICAAIGILFMLLTVLLAVKVIPAICQGIASIFKSISGKKKGAGV